MTQQISPLFLAVVISGVLLSCAGCRRQHGNAGVPPPADFPNQMTALEAKRQSYEASLKAMNSSQLIDELAADSKKGREPFNSAAYRETVSRGHGIAGELKARLTTNDESSLLSLLALRTIDPELYRSLDPAFRVSVLTEALKTSRFFNTWGVPYLYWEDGAKAILDEGPTAAGPLELMLRDKRAAPLWGPRGFAIDKRYRYRVCDYVWALLHPNTQVPDDPAERDRLMGL